MNRLISIIIAFLVSLILIGTIQRQRGQIQSQGRTIAALSDSSTTYVTKLQEQAQKRKMLEIGIKDLKRINEGLHAKVKALDLKAKQALTVTEVKTETKIIETVKLDTIYGKITGSYKDMYNTISTTIEKDSVKLSYIGTDTLTGVVAIRQKRFLFFRWGVKSVEYHVSNKNPKVKTSINLAVKLK
nr:MAG TPA: hypothetical protein [Caudoviricetes sp.]